MKTFLKKAVFNTLQLPGVAPALAAMIDVQATIFMLHRFSAPAAGLAGHDPKVLDGILAYLRREKYNLVSIEEIVRRLREGEPLNRSVGFTIDDAYWDHGEVAEPIFARYDCPVTVFVVSHFADGKIWLWWDQISYMMDNTKRQQVKVRVGAQEVQYSLQSQAERNQAAHDLTYRCMDSPHEVRQQCVADLSVAADVEIPERAPAIHRPLSWDELRKLEKGVMTFGPHTMNHPALSTMTAEDSDYEISESWRTLSAQLKRPVPVFCYPHGRARDFGPREMASVIKAGMWGGVRGFSGEWGPNDFRTAPAICEVPRYAYPETLSRVLKQTAGLSQLKNRLRGAGRP